MKKVFLSFFVAATFLTVVHAQTRDCGTMEYYDLRKQQDPSVEKRMDENEKLIETWIKDHPAPAVSAKAVLPAVPGFIITANEKEDRINYANAKSKYLAEHGLPNGNIIQANISNDKNLRDKKRKSNSFITKN
jgi:hypothetical protein